jgi:tripartite-type tricarboxylate transporter receptor subunit TctC
MMIPNPLLFRRTGLLAASLCTAAAVIAPLPAGAQAFPAKPIHMVVPYPPGGVDAFARVMTPKMEELLGQSIIVDNRGGANGTIGASLVAREQPDGYTVLFAASSTIIGAPKMMKSVPFDPVKDFSPVSELYSNLRIITVHESVPIKSLRELIDYAKRNPGKLSFGSSGIGSTFHLDGEILKAAAGIDIVHVPYKGTGPMLTDLAAGRVEIGIGATSSFEQYIRSGKMRPIAMFEKKRYAKYPNVPTVAEILPGTQKSPSWIALMAPAGVPRPIVQRLNAAAVAAMQAPTAKAYFDKTGTDIIGSTPEELAKTIREDLVRMENLLKRLGIQPE